MKTRLTDILGIRHPIVNAPMTPQAGGILARNVTEAGGFGMIGFDESESVESLREQIMHVRDGCPDRAFGIGLVRWVIDERPELFDLALACKPRLVSISFGDPEPYVKRLHEAGILVAAQVQSRKHAHHAETAGWT